jgi:hypothetical protein
MLNFEVFAFFSLFVVARRLVGKTFEADIARNSLFGRSQEIHRFLFELKRTIEWSFRLVVRSIVPFQRFSHSISLLKGLNFGIEILIHSFNFSMHLKMKQFFNSFNFFVEILQSFLAFLYVSTIVFFLFIYEFNSCNFPCRFTKKSELMRIEALILFVSDVSVAIQKFHPV